MKPKRLLLYALLTNLVCLFPAGHAIVPLGLFEPILIAGAISGSAESPAMWISSAVLLLLGQIVVIFALAQKAMRKVHQFGILGLLILTSAVIAVYYTMHEQVWTITFVTAIPFIVTSVLFFRTFSKDEKC